MRRVTVKASNVKRHKKRLQPSIEFTEVSDPKQKTARTKKRKPKADVVVTLSPKEDQRVEENAEEEATDGT